MRQWFITKKRMKTRWRGLLVAPSLSKYNGRQMTAANFSDFCKRNYMVLLTYLLDRPAFSAAKAFNLYLFFTGHDIWGSQFLFTSLWLPPAYTKMCHYVTNSNWIFWKVCTTTQTHISNYTLLQFLAHIYLGKLIESF